MWAAFLCSCVLGYYVKSTSKVCMCVWHNNKCLKSSVDWPVTHSRGGNDGPFSTSQLKFEVPGAALHFGSSIVFIAGMESIQEWKGCMLLYALRFWGQSWSKNTSVLVACSRLWGLPSQTSGGWQLCPQRMGERLGQKSTHAVGLCEKPSCISMVLLECSAYFVLH